MGITSVSYDLFSEIDKLMSNYLTSHILSAERLEIAQYLYFIVSKVELDIIETIGPKLLLSSDSDIYLCVWN